MSRVSESQCIYLLSKNNHDKPNLLFQRSKQSRLPVLACLSAEQTLKGSSKFLARRTMPRVDYITSKGSFAQPGEPEVLPRALAKTRPAHAAALPQYEIAGNARELTGWVAIK